jgi:glycosyltransferase involved in cell wall biosynthesis
MIPVYNCAGYLRETLLSVLCQDPGADRMQIEVIDNCSTADDPESVVREIGRGRVGFHRQPSNVGAIENFNTCIRRSRGEWVHVLHGDDTVRPGLYARMEQGIIAHPSAGAAACRIIQMDEEGHWLGLPALESRAPGLLGNEFVENLLLDQRLYFAGMIVRRATYEQLGGFRPDLVHCADWDMWKRIALHQPIFYDPEPLACYRVHAGQDTGRLVKTGENVVDERRSIQISCGDLSLERVGRLRRDAMKAAAVRAIRRARTLWANGNREIALRQIREATRCSLAPAVLVRLAYLFAWMAAR